MEPSDARGRKTLERDKERPELKAGVGRAVPPMEPSAARNIECILKSRRYVEAINPEFAIDAVKKARQFWWSA
ncbi:hypothetical protein [uncultured Imperialibacter sp.]|uniref:hypothetical protein n=1 Tax=uncultured Imperialibacter sp. TaxID=1672639 RepID=UPI0030DDA4B4|tara:strand:- start:10535 stop:10753 length:219 start_codon:yes stop_codon:yes gene_type:complete